MVKTSSSSYTKVAAKSTLEFFDAAPVPHPAVEAYQKGTSSHKDIQRAGFAGRAPCLLRRLSGPSWIDNWSNDSVDNSGNKIIHIEPTRNPSAGITYELLNGSFVPSIAPQVDVLVIADVARMFQEAYGQLTCFPAPLRGRPYHVTDVLWSLESAGTFSARGCSLNIRIPYHSCAIQFD